MTMSTSPELWRLSAVEMARRYRDGSLTPYMVAQACQARLEAVNPQLNAVVARRDAAFLQEAEAATTRFAVGQPLSQLDGIPLTVKDNLHMHDQVTTWGSLALRDYRPSHDEVPVARLRASGALILGKTNVPEFTLEGYTSNRLFGTTRNPWNLALTPGGSSGGAVAGVAAGIAPLALGTDGGGSIRRPSSHCGVVGLKPSIGAIARGAGLPALLLDFEVVGPMGRSVADVKLLFDALRGPSAADRDSLAAAGAALGKPRIGPLRVLYVPTLDGAPVDPEIAENCAQAVGQLVDLGHSVTTGALPLDLGFMVTAWPVIGQVGLAHLFEILPEWSQGASAKYLEMAQQGSAQPAARLWEVMAAVEKLRSACERLFREIDVLITPTAAALPWPADEAFPPVIAGQAVGPRGHAIFTAWVNAAGLPALAVPVTPSLSGLPIGVQMVGAYGADDMLLELGASYEVAAPWTDRWPAL